MTHTIILQNPLQKLSLHEILEVFLSDYACLILVSLQGTNSPLRNGDMTDTGQEGSEGSYRKKTPPVGKGS